MKDMVKLELVVTKKRAKGIGASEVVYTGHPDIQSALCHVNTGDAELGN